jgi:capsular polysaccharide biosynthesis protein
MIVISHPAVPVAVEGEFNPDLLVSSRVLSCVRLDTLLAKQTDVDMMPYPADFLSIPNCTIIVTDRHVFYLDEENHFFPSYYPKPWVYSDFLQADGTLAIDCTNFPQHTVRTTLFAPFLVSGNWFHNYIDNYTRMYFYSHIADASVKVAVPFWIIGPEDSSRSDRMLLSSIFIQEDQGILLAKGVYKVDRVILPPLGNVSDYMCRDTVLFVSDKLKKALNIRRPTHPLRLLVSRADIGVRNITNEDDLMTALLPLRFTRICPGDYSLRTQLEIFASAEAIIGVHGQGLTSMLTSTDCRQILEFEAAGWGATCYRAIAACLDIPYSPAPCQLEEYRNPARFDWLARADVARCTELIERALN